MGLSLGDDVILEPVMMTQYDAILDLVVMMTHS